MEVVLWRALHAPDDSPEQDKVEAHFDLLLHSRAVVLVEWHLLEAALVVVNYSERMHV